MKGAIVCVIVLIFISCNNTPGKKETTKVAASVAEISNDSLGRFVISTRQISMNEAQDKLSSIIASVKEDSLKLRNTVSLLMKPFSDPNSTFRNEDLYIQLLNAQIASEWYITEEKEAANNKLRLAMQNRVGQPANDFSYLTPDGAGKRMYSIKSPLTLLYFYNPECHACIEMKESIRSSAAINSNIASGRLKLFAVYTDPDEALWRKHLPENPKQWINGRDTSEHLWRNKIYDLRAIPTLYLLDQNKNVLLKDASIQQIEANLK